jgi:glycosyltransferase involved in cell wall biosynthesis
MLLKQERKPLISIIIPCYNSARFLEATLDSVFQQSFSDYEIIVINDGSTDNTAQIIDTFGDKVRTESTPNRGASSARNLGTSLASGEFIQYLDADDLLLPNALEKRITALQQTEADVAYSDWQKLEEQENADFTLGEIVAHKIEDISEDPEIAIFTDFWCPPASLMYRKTMVDKIGRWNESLPIIQDARFLLDAALLGGKFFHTPGVDAHYRVHEKNSLSKRSRTDFAQDCLNNAYQVEKIWLQRKEKITEEQRNALIKVYGGLARFFFEHDRHLFCDTMNRVYDLDPHYLPSHPKSLHWLSICFGYETAEAIALKYRKLKQKLSLPNKI